METTSLQSTVRHSSGNPKPVKELALGDDRNSILLKSSSEGRLHAAYDPATHWGTFKLIDEPLNEPPQRLKAERIRRG